MAPRKKTPARPTARDNAATASASPATPPVEQGGALVAIIDPADSLSDEQRAAREAHESRGEQALTPDPHPAAVDPEPEPGAAEEPVVLEPEPVIEMPKEISDKLPLDTPEATRNRVLIWLAETRYLFSTLEHEVGGEAGEIIAYLKARL